MLVAKLHVNFFKGLKPLLVRLSRLPDLNSNFTPKTAKKRTRWLENRPKLKHLLMTSFFLYCARYDWLSSQRIPNKPSFCVYQCCSTNPNPNPKPVDNTEAERQNGQSKWGRGWTFLWTNRVLWTNVPHVCKTFRSVNCHKYENERDKPSVKESNR